MSLATLSTDGNLEDKKYIMVKLFEYFLASKYSQSYFYENISSLDWLISEYDIDEDLDVQIQRSLYLLYSSNYNDVNVEVTFDDIDNDNNYKIYINITADDYTLSRSVDVIDNKLDYFKEDINLYK